MCLCGYEQLQTDSVPTGMESMMRAEGTTSRTLSVRVLSRISKEELGEQLMEPSPRP